MTQTGRQPSKDCSYSNYSKTNKYLPKCKYCGQDENDPCFRDPCYRFDK